MAHDIALYKERHELLKTFIGLGMRASMMLKLTEPMENMSETEKEAFAKELRLKLLQEIR